MHVVVGDVIICPLRGCKLTMYDRVRQLNAGEVLPKPYLSENDFYKTARKNVVYYIL